MDVPSVSVADVPADAYLVDCREADEWEAGHIAGSHHVPMSEFVARQEDVPRNRAVVVVCTVGGRSAQVAAYLNQQGWHAQNLTGGVKAWVAAGRELVTDTEAPPKIL